MTASEGSQSHYLHSLKAPTRSSSMIWSDGASQTPKMFPGVVHERTRRNSVRQASGSEKDDSSPMLSRPMTRDGHEDAVPEVPAEEDD